MILHLSLSCKTCDSSTIHKHDLLVLYTTTTRPKFYMQTKRRGLSDIGHAFINYRCLLFNTGC